MSLQFKKWMNFYGKMNSNYELLKDDFLQGSGMAERINAASLVDSIVNAKARRQRNISFV